jgi:hypothetical protein
MGSGRGPCPSGCHCWPGGRPWSWPWPCCRCCWLSQAAKCCCWLGPCSCRPSEPGSTKAPTDRAPRCCCCRCWPGWLGSSSATCKSCCPPPLDHLGLQLLPPLRRMGLQLLLLEEWGCRVLPCLPQVCIQLGRGVPGNGRSDAGVRRLHHLGQSGSGDGASSECDSCGQVGSIHIQLQLLDGCCFAAALPALDARLSRWRATPVARKIGINSCGSRLQAAAHA